MANYTSLFKNPTLFSPAVIQRLTFGSAVITNQIAANVTESNITSTSSFRYMTPWFPGIKSTQQIPVDFSKFENHTFFNSAESSVNVAFDQVINKYPFDGSRKEYEKFFDDLTGFENWVYHKFPKHKGFLHFSGTQTGENPASGYDDSLGTHIVIKDMAGADFPFLSKNSTGESVIGPRVNESITFEMSLFVPAKENHNQVIIQKLSGTNDGLTIGLQATNSTTACNLVMIISSGTTDSQIAYMSASMEVEKNRFSNIVATYDAFSPHQRIRLYQSGTLISESQFTDVFHDEFKFQYSDMLIGSGVMHISSSSPIATTEYFAPNQTFSGAIDELRVFNTVRTTALQKEFQFKNVFSIPSLRLYYKFNEPTGSYTNNNVVLDSSGQSLHSTIANFAVPLRDLTMGSAVSMSLPLKNERLDINPVLFPTTDDVVKLNQDLLFSASFYDVNNPNLITKLVPEHYLLLGQTDLGQETMEGPIAQPYATGSLNMPQGGNIGSAQIMSMLLFTWAKYFDELKMITDQFSKLLTVDYEKNDTIADQFLTFLGEYWGFTLPGFYSNASMAQFNEGENLLADPSYSKFSLRYVQNELWRRILINLREILNSKGTVYSIESLLRACGLDPYNNFRIREFGGARSIEPFRNPGRNRKTDHLGMLDFSGTLAGVTDPEDVNTLGIHASVPFVMSPFLSGSRVEVGFPTPQGTMIEPGRYIPHGISNNLDDGLFTSGSFTYEALYKFEKTGKMGGLTHFLSESLMRLHSTGSANSAESQAVFFNLLALSESISSNFTGSVQLMGRPTVNVANGPTLHLLLTGVNIFDGNAWHVSWGRRCAEEIDSIGSSSYFLRAARQNYGDLVRYYTTSSYFIEWPEEYSKTNDGLSNVSSLHNISGTFIVIGSQSIGTNTAGYFLNDSALGPDHLPRVTDFSGKISQARFWSKALTYKETVAHTITPTSLGVRNPQVNYNFPEKTGTALLSGSTWATPSGSFARLRLDVSMNQPVSRSFANGDMTLLDLTQDFSSGTRGAPWVHPDNHDKILYAMSGSGFEGDKVVIKLDRFDYTYINPKFDERSEDNKIRVRTFSKLQNEIDYDGVAAPRYEVLRSEEAQDDNRFIIENSFVQALNEDIINIFSTLDEWDNIMGRPELLFAEYYPDLLVMRDIYFNRLTSRIKIKEFFEFFKWFDDSIGIIIERLLPRKTDFLGVQFTIESHMLERTKFAYKYQDIYVPPKVRDWNGTTISGGTGFFSTGDMDLIITDDDDYSVVIVLTPP